MRSEDGRFEYLDMGYQLVPAGSPPQAVCRFRFRCRQASGTCDVLMRGRGHDVPNKTWVWDGNVDRPTLSPSINCTTPTDDGTPCWHGFIEKGVFVNVNKQPEPTQ